MTRFIIGGRELDTTKDEVISRMRSVPPEPIREHLVEVSDIEFPPKQVLEEVSGFDRQTFTTMEATRVLRRLGFALRRAGDNPRTQEAAAQIAPSSVENRLSAVESALAVAQEAIAALRGRVAELEDAGPVTMAAEERRTSGRLETLTRAPRRRR